MEEGESDDTKGAIPHDDFGLANRTIGEPAPRADHIGDLARRLCGFTSPAPDFSAAVPLVDAVRDYYNDLVANNLIDRIIQLRRFINADESSERHNLALVRNMRNNLRVICRPFLYDFASTVTVLARTVERALKPVAPPVTASAEVAVTFVRVSPSHSVGDRVGMPDGRRGVIVVARNPATGMAGVVPCENSEPSPYGDSPMGMTDADESSDAGY